MFALVEFTGPNPLIAVVHKNWIFNNKCYWPPFAKNTNKLNTAVRNGQPPDPKTWSTYDMHVVGGKFFETYEAARRRLSFPQDKLDASDLSSAEEVSKLRKRTATVDDDSDSDIDRSTVIHETPKTTKRGRQHCSRSLLLPPPPAPNAAQVASQGASSPVPSLVLASSLNTDAGGSTSAIAMQPSAIQAASPTIGPAQNNQFGDQEALGIGLSSSDFVSGYEQQNMFLTTGVQSFQQPVFDKDEAIKNLQRQMNVLTAKMDFALDILRTLMHARSIPNGTDNSSKLSAFCFPLSSMEDFNNLEIELKDVATKSALLDLLASRGGDNVNQITYRIVAWLLSDELQCEFSIAGKKNKSGQQKRCFRISRLFAVICDGVKKQPKGSVASDKDVEKAVEYWLKRASKRLMNERSGNPAGSPEDITE